MANSLLRPLRTKGSTLTITIRAENAYPRDASHTHWVCCELIQCIHDKSLRPYRLYSQCYIYLIHPISNPQNPSSSPPLISQRPFLDLYKISKQPTPLEKLLARDNEKGEMYLHPRLHLNQSISISISMHISTPKNKKIRNMFQESIYLPYHPT